MRILLLSTMLILVHGYANSQRAGASYSEPRNGRFSTTINSHWVFTYAPETDSSDYSPVSLNDSQWQAISIPHTWSTYETTGEVHPFIKNPSEKDDPYWWYGVGWYRKKFRIAKSEEHKNISLEFDGVMKNCRIFLNGKEIGTHLGGFTSFSFDISDIVKCNEENVLAVAVSNRRNDKFRVPPMTAGNWVLYGGIYRDVRIVIKDRLHIPFQGSYRHEGGTFITTPVVNKKEAVVNIRTFVKNTYPQAVNCKILSIIVNPENKIITVLEKIEKIQANQLFEFKQQSAPVKSPRLWSPANPNLYQVFTEVYLDGRLVDNYRSPLGFRWFWWDHSKNRLILNGVEVHIHGTNRHQEYPWLGDAIPKWMHETDLIDIRFNLNHNFIRTCHYTQDKFVYDWCDKNGLIVAEEVPNIKDIDFSEEVQEQHVKEMIRRDRNHPSILFWSMGNETNDAADSRWAKAEDSTRIIHARHVKGNSAGEFVMHTDEDMDMENLLRCTVRGWYNADVKNLEPQNNQWTGHEEFQHKMAMKEGGSQRGIINMGNGVMWIYADHGADREYVNSPLKHINPKGWVDLYRQPKYLYYLWQANYHDKPMVFVHPHFWREQYKGRKKDFVVDSNCDKVELKVNGKSAGVMYPGAETFHTVTFKDITVEDGVLEVTGTRGGETVYHKLNMAGKPRKLILTASHVELDADLASVAIIKADVVDANGNHVYGANPKLTWEVDGPATLTGPAVWTTDADKHEDAEGTFYIDMPVCNVLRSVAREGTAKVKVMAHGLETGEVAITFKKQVITGSIIIEPEVTPEGRKKPHRTVANNLSKDSVPGRMNETRTDLSLPVNNNGNSVRKAVMQKIGNENPGTDTTLFSVRLLADIYGKHLHNNKGLLVADDYNFIIAKYNSARQIELFVETLNVPVSYKNELVNFYYHAILHNGENISVEEIRRRFSIIPEKYELVITENHFLAGDSTLRRSKQVNIQKLVMEAFPSLNLPASEMQNYLLKVQQLNPWVETIIKSGNGDSVVNEYFTGKGKMVLLPARF